SDPREAGSRGQGDGRAVEEQRTRLVVGRAVAEVRIVQGEERGAGAASGERAGLDPVTRGEGREHAGVGARPGADAALDVLREEQVGGAHAADVGGRVLLEL